MLAPLAVEGQVKDTSILLMFLGSVLFVIPVPVRSAFFSVKQFDLPHVVKITMDPAEARSTMGIRIMKNDLAYCIKRYALVSAIYLSPSPFI